MNDETEGLADQGWLIQDAFARGQRALAAGDIPEAVRWFNRVRRMSPDDLTVTLTLASISIGQDPAKAIALFQEVLARADIREAWLGMTTAHRQLGDVAAARLALQRALSHHAPHAGMTAISDQIVRESGAPGWCGLTGDGVLIIRTANREPTYAYLDRARVKAGLLPAHWPKASAITVRAGGHHLIGSPISPRAIGRVEGCVDVWDSGLRGWAWQPGAPEVDPVLTVASGGMTQQIVARHPAEGIADLPPLARPRSFVIQTSPLPGGGAPVHVRGHDDRDLLGSPVPWGKIMAVPAPRAAPATTPGPGAVLIVIQPRPQSGSLLPCLRSVLRSLGRPVPGTAPRIMVLGEKQADCDREARQQGVSVLWLRGDIGPGLTPRPGDDLVWLDGGAVVPDNEGTSPPGWLDRLRQAAYAAPDIGSVTALSNRGQAAYPSQSGVEPEWFALRPGPDDEKGPVGAPPPEEPVSKAEATRILVNELDRLAFAANGAEVAELAHAGGPCLFIRGDCLGATGKLRTEILPAHDGAWEDFSLRAHAAGWRHVALTGLFVGQMADDGSGEAESANAARRQLRRRSIAILSALHPDRHTRNGSFRALDLLGASRRRLDLARWKGPRENTAIIVTHDDGGGVGRRVDSAVASARASGQSTIVLRPAALASGTAGLKIDEGDPSRFPNLIFAMPAERTAVLDLLRAAKPARASLHHYLNHDPSVIEMVRSLNVPYEAHAHDAAWYCPRVALVGGGNRYCGEPEPAVCESCVAENGGFLGEDISVAALLARSRTILGGATRIIAPSEDAAGRLARHFSDLHVEAVPHEDDDAVEEPPPIQAVAGTVRVCVAGAIGLHKGYYVLLDCARDARDRGLELTFLVAGTTIDDQRLIETGRVFVTGRYDGAEATDLIREQNAALGFLPSICPETWCLGLTELWRAGLRVAAFDIGAQAERIRRTGRGFLLPLETPAATINDQLLRIAKI